jgi:hypothetical protein
VQNSSNDSQYLYDDGGHSDDGSHSDDSEIIEHAINNHNDSSVTDDGQANIEHLDHVAEHAEQRYTEKFKLKGTSFHNHF